MKTIKVSGRNSIPTNIFKLFKKEFSKPLIDMITISFNQGAFQNLLKRVNVTPTLTVITTDLFPFYLISVKVMKNLCKHSPNKLSQEK